MVGNPSNWAIYIITMHVSNVPYLVALGVKQEENNGEKPETIAVVHNATSLVDGLVQAVSHFYQQPPPLEDGKSYHGVVTVPDGVYTALRHCSLPCISLHLLGLLKRIAPDVGRGYRAT